MGGGSREGFIVLFLGGIEQLRSVDPSECVVIVVGEGIIIFNLNNVFVFLLRSSAFLVQMFVDVPERDLDVAGRAGGQLRFGGEE